MREWRADSSCSHHLLLDVDPDEHAIGECRPHVEHNDAKPDRPSFRSSIKGPRGAIIPGWAGLWANDKTSVTVSALSFVPDRALVDPDVPPHSAMATTDHDAAIVAGFGEARRNEAEFEKDTSSSHPSQDPEYMNDGVHDGLTFPTEEEIATLPRVADTLPINAYCECRRLVTRPYVVLNNAQ
jgi:hypothetical protein